MKLSEYKDEEALEVLADIIGPCAEILDKNVISDIRSRDNVAAVSRAIKHHKHAVMELLAALDRVPVEEYHCNIFTLPLKLLEIFNDKDFIEVFTSQGQNMVSISSGSATENSEAEV